MLTYVKSCSSKLQFVYKIILYIHYHHKAVLFITVKLSERSLTSPLMYTRALPNPVTGMQIFVSLPLTETPNDNLSSYCVGRPNTIHIDLVLQPKLIRLI